MIDITLHPEKVAEVAAAARERIEKYNIRAFKGMDKPLFLISDAYPGIWLEHVYDSVISAKMDPSKLPLAVNTLNLFMDYQRPDGQLPCYVWDANKMPDCPPEKLIGYGQTQECVSFARLCYEVYEMTRDRGFLEKAYRSASMWENWFRNTRMTTGRGLVEMFYGYDTGHDNSGRLEGMLFKGNAGDHIPTPEEKEKDVAPIIAVDMNCNFYATEVTLADMARELGLPEDEKNWREKAKDVKKRLFEVCFDKDDCFFYDADKNGNRRKFLSSTIFHLFLEKVLDPEEDAALIREIYERHISNPDEFNTPFPYPSMAVSDPSVNGHAERNCWGYYSQGLIALRCTRWMDYYGFTADFDRLCERWLTAWTSCFGRVNLGQELDPFTGEPTACSEWYSSCMIFFIFAAKRLGYID